MTRAVHRALVAPSSVLLAVVAGAQPRSARSVAPTDETILTTVEEGYSTAPYQVIWIQNTSTVPIQVYSVTLHACENVKQRCETVPLHIKLRPGARGVLRRVEPH